MKSMKKGFALITVLVLTTVLLVLGAFFTNLVIGDLRISSSLKSGTQALYVAQAGIEEAIWLTKHNQTYETEFEQGTINRTFSRSGIFDGKGGYEVHIIGIDKAKAEVTSKGFYNLGLKKATRVVKVKFFKALNPNPVWDKAAYGASDLEFFASQVNLTGGNLYAKDDVVIWGISIVNVEKDVLAVDKIDVSWLSQLNVGGKKYSTNYPPPPDPIEMPQIDFDSDNPNSYLKRAEAAGTVYTEQEFKNMLKNQSPLTLNGVIYVKGSIDIKKGQSLTVNGTLVADGDISVGLTSLTPPFGDAYLTINKPSDNSSSGILSKSKIKIGVHATNTYINGLVYAMDEISFNNFTSSLTINGGLMAREVKIFNIWEPVNITFDKERVEKTLYQEASYSPTVEVEYWEEEY